jgi:hypothetical protein
MMCRCDGEMAEYIVPDCFEFEFIYNPFASKHEYGSALTYRRDKYLCLKSGAQVHFRV